MASTSDKWNPLGTERYDIIVGYGPDGGGYDKFIVDNIKIWDYAKTDYSDRFVESFPTETMGWVDGRVTDAVTGNPLAAYVGVEGQSSGTSTDASGNYRLYLEPGHYTLRASASRHLASTVEVDVLAGEGASLDIRLAPVPRPDNDDFAQATPIEPTTMPFELSYEVDTSEATSQDGDLCGPNSVWYVFTPTVLTLVTATTAGSEHGTGLGVFTGELGSLAIVQHCNFNYPPNGSRARFVARPDVRYYLAVGAYDDGPGLVRLRVNGSEPLPNDIPEGAIAIEPAGLPFQLSYELDTRGATGDVADPCPDWGCARCPSVWYRFTPTLDACVTASTSGTDYCTNIGVFTGQPYSFSWVAGCFVSCPWDSNRDVRFDAMAGTTYYILVSAPNEDGGQLSLQVEGSGPPTNDDLAAAQVIATLPYSDTLNTTCITWDAPPGAGWCGGGRGNVWYQLMLPETRFVRFSTEGSNYWAPIDVYTGTPEALNHIACSSPVVEFRAEGGQAHYVMVSGEGGDLALSVTDLGPALEVAFQASAGTVNSKTGAATIQGMVQCNQPVAIHIWGQLRQRLGRKTVIAGPFDVTCACDGETPWSAIVRSDGGAYGGGAAEVLAEASGCTDRPGDCDGERIADIVRLKGGGGR